ncbi:hypothetical protein SDC9_106791 [bioreactor metagenome]|uniref:Uncharacterized protein n=1 Tax=bioreactor metagenome TaxID=1076179 RepID=A0A645B3E5_9ZZZZ
MSSAYSVSILSLSAKFDIQSFPGEITFVPQNLRVLTAYLHISSLETRLSGAKVISLMPLTIAFSLQKTTSLESQSIKLLLERVIPVEPVAAR